MQKTLIALSAFAVVLSSGPPGQAQDGLVARQLELERKLESLQQEVGELQQGLKPIILYQCPSNLHTLEGHDSGDVWLSVGCLGQISSISTCAIYWRDAAAVRTRVAECAPVTFYQKP